MVTVMAVRKWRNDISTSFDATCTGRANHTTPHAAQPSRRSRAAKTQGLGISQHRQAGVVTRHAPALAPGPRLRSYAREPTVSRMMQRTRVAHDAPLRRLIEPAGGQAA